MGLHESRGQLAKSLKDLRQKWLETQGKWNDIRSRGFEAKYLTPVEMDLKTAVAAMDEVAPVIQQARRDCQ